MRNEIRIEKENATFQHIIVLKTNRNKRYKAKEFFVEGVDNINLAVKTNWKIKHWIYGEFCNLSSWAKDKIKNTKSEINYSLSRELLEKVSGKVDTSELMCIIEMKEQDIPMTKNPKIILLDRPSKHGNLGSIIRSAEAFGFDGIVITGHAIDKYAPEVITASMGSFFNIPIITLQTNEQYLEWLKNLKTLYPTLQCVATTLDGEKNIDEVDFSRPTILLLGNEGEGLSKFYRENCDCRAKIQMAGEADSFNIACAGTVFMYEINRQRKNKC